MIRKSKINFINRLLLLSFSLALIISIINCKKKNDVKLITIPGNIFDENANTNIQGVTVKLQSQEVSGGTFSNSYNTIESSTTDANGNYSFEFENRNPVSYKIIVTKNGYFGIEDIFNPDNISTETTNTKNYSLFSQSWFTINIKNTTPFDNTDEILYHNLSGINNCSTCCNGSFSTYTGTNIDTTITCPLYGSQYIVFEYFVTKDQIISGFKDSVYCTPTDTAFYQLNY